MIESWKAGKLKVGSDNERNGGGLSGRFGLRLDLEDGERGLIGKHAWNRASIIYILQSKATMSNNNFVED